MLTYTDRGFPLFALVLERWGTDYGFAYLIVVVSTSILGGSSLLFASGCQVAAFARDGGLPFPHVFSYVHPRTSMPLASIALITIVAALALLFSLSPVAGAIIYSLAVIANYLTFVIPIALRVFLPARFIPGPWNCGKFSWPVAVLALASSVWLLIMECFPTSPNWTASTFNYDWVVTAGVLLLAVVFWLTIGRNYTGVNLEALQAMQQHHRALGTGGEKHEEASWDE